jgi:hypothetical protein
MAARLHRAFVGPPTRALPLARHLAVPSSAYDPPPLRASLEGNSGKRPGEAGEATLLQLCPGQTALESGFSDRFPGEAVLDPLGTSSPQTTSEAAPNGTKCAVEILSDRHMEACCGPKFRWSHLDLVASHQELKARW